MNVTQREMQLLLNGWQGANNGGALPDWLRQYATTMVDPTQSQTADNDRAMVPGYDLSSLPMYSNEFNSAPIDPTTGQPLWTPTDTSGDWRRSALGLASVGIGGPLLGAGMAGMAAGGAGAAGAGGAALGGEASLLGAEAAAMGGAGAGAAGAAGGAGTAAGGLGTAAMGAGSLGSIGSALAGNPALAGAALGGIMGAAGSGPETQTSSQDLPAWMQPYAQSFLSRADQLSQQPFAPYAGPGVAGLNADQTAATSQIRGMATSGDPLVNAARQQQQGLLSGSMLNANPYIDQVARGIGDRMGESYATGTRAGMAGGFNQAGHSPYSSAMQQTVGNADRAFADSLGQTMSGLYMGNYQNERAAQDQAARSSLGFSQDQRANVEGLFNAGLLGQQNQQAQNDYARAEWDRQQAWPQQQLGLLGSAINPAFGQTRTQTDPGVNPWQGALGGALAGAGAARSIFGGQSNSLFGGQGTQPATRGNWYPWGT